MDDTISRQAAIDALLENVTTIDGYCVTDDPIIYKDDAIKAINDLQPAQRKGKWIHECTGIYMRTYRCSECGRQVVGTKVRNVTEEYPYCHCGAEMKGEEDETD